MLCNPFLPLGLQTWISLFFPCLFSPTSFPICAWLTWRTTMNIFPHSRERQNCRLGCSALLWRFIASEMNYLNVMAAPCQGKGKPCITRNAYGKMPLMAGPQMCAESMVCALTCSKILCMNTVTFSLVVFARSLRAKYSSRNLKNMSLQILACLCLFSCAKLSLQSSTWCSQHKFTLLTSQHTLYMCVHILTL